MPLQIVRQDITKMQVDAIVNTTNEEMVPHSGVDLAVHQAAGPQLAQACAKLAPLGLGTAKVTDGYDLPARYVIHTSGPVWEGGLQGESILLKSCYIESLKLAVAHGFQSVAFPLISSGAYGYPKDQVLKFATQVITEFLYHHELTVYLCVYDRTSYEFSRRLYDDICDWLRDDEEYLIDGGLSASDAAPPPRELRTLSKRAKLRGDTAPRPTFAAPSRGAVGSRGLDDYLRDLDQPFGVKLFQWIDRRGMTDVECYKKANVDRKTFSKIKCHPDTYRPSLQTAVAFAVALRLNLDETQDLLASAGLTLSHSRVFDKIIRYFIQKGVYDITEINEALFEFDQMLLGC